MKKRVLATSNLTPFIGKRCLILSVAADKTCYTLSLARLRKVTKYPETREVELIFDNHSFSHYPGNGWSDIILALPDLPRIARRIPIVNKF